MTAGSAPSDPFGGVLHVEHAATLDPDHAGAEADDDAAEPAAWVQGEPLGQVERLVLGLHRTLDDLFDLEACPRGFSPDDAVRALDEATRYRNGAHGIMGLAGTLFNDVVDPVSNSEPYQLLGFAVDTLEEDLVARLRLIAQEKMPALASDVANTGALGILIEAARRLRHARRRRVRHRVYPLIGDAVEAITGRKSKPDAIRKAIERR